MSRPSPASSATAAIGLDPQAACASTEETNRDVGCMTALELSPDERRRRAEAVRFANASIKLEGLILSAAAHARAKRFIDGEIDLAEFLRDR